MASPDVGTSTNAFTTTSSLPSIYTHALGSPTIHGRPIILTATAQATTTIWDYESNALTGLFSIVIAFLVICVIGVVYAAIVLKRPHRHVSSPPYIALITAAIMLAVSYIISSASLKDPGSSVPLQVQSFGRFLHESADVVFIISLLLLIRHRKTIQAQIDLNQQEIGRALSSFDSVSNGSSASNLKGGSSSIGMVSPRWMIEAALLIAMEAVIIVGAVKNKRSEFVPERWPYDFAMVSENYKSWKPYHVYVMLYALLTSDVVASAGGVWLYTKRRGRTDSVIDILVKFGVPVIVLRALYTSIHDLVITGNSYSGNDGDGLYFSFIIMQGMTYSALIFVLVWIGVSPGSPSNEGEKGSELPV